MAAFLLLSIMSRTWGSFLSMPTGAWLFQYENQSYLPLSPSELRRRFPVRYLGTMGTLRPGYFELKQDSPLPEKVEAGPSGVNVTKSAGNELLITGRDKKGFPWRVNLGAFVLAYACRFYSADLDRNGIRDLVLIHPTGGNGFAPTSHFFSLTFDEQGRPLPFEADGYFQDSTDGIFDLVDLNSDGRAELIYMNFDDGYWITNLYEVSGAKWQRVKGLHGRRSYPLYTRFTYRANQKLITPAAGRHPLAPDLSNKEPRFRGQLISYRWANVERSEDIELVVKTDQGQKVTTKPVSWYDSFMVVLDGAQERIIVSLAADEKRIRSVLDKIVANAYRVSVYGDRRGNGTGSEILWASRSTKARLTQSHLLSDTPPKVRTSF